MLGVWPRKKMLTFLWWMKGKEREQGTESVFEEIMNGNFPKLKETDI